MWNLYKSFGLVYSFHQELNPNHIKIAVSMAEARKMTLGDMPAAECKEG